MSTFSVKWVNMLFIISDNELNSQLENGKISFPTFDKEQLQILKSERKKRKSNFDAVITLRNSYAHGATPTDAQCEADIKKFDSFFLSRFQFLK